MEMLTRFLGIFKHQLLLAAGSVDETLCNGAMSNTANSSNSDYFCSAGRRLHEERKIQEEGASGGDGMWRGCAMRIFP